MKHRLERVNEVLKRELSELVRREINFAGALVTIQQVDVTPDLKHAHVYVGVIGPHEERIASIAKLHDRRQVLQRDLSKRVVLKFTPHLHFTLDNAIERGSRVLSILEGLQIPPDESLEKEAGERNEDDASDID